MGALWKDRENADLILNYNVLLWGLREKCHCRAREYSGVPYVVPQVCAPEFFENQIKSGMIAAKKAIKTILSERGVKTIPKLKLTIMAGEEADMRDIGWRAYKTIQQSVLEATGRGAM